MIVVVNPQNGLVWPDFALKKCFQGDLGTVLTLELKIDFVTESNYRMRITRVNLVCPKIFPEISEKSLFQTSYHLYVWALNY